MSAVRPSIAFLTRQLTRGGAERQLVALATGLARRGWTVSVFVFYGGGALEEGLVAAGVSVQALGKSGRWSMLPTLVALWKSLRRDRPDYLHAYLVIPNIVVALLRPFLPGTRTVWGVRASAVEWSAYDWTLKASFRLSCLLSRVPHLIVANSHAGRAFHVRSGYPGDRLVVVPNGIDPEAFRPAPEARDETRREWGVEAAGVVVGIVGRLDPMKDHATFLRAAAVLASQQPSIHYVIVGGGPEPYASSLRTLAASLGLESKVHWAGDTAVTAATYSALDLVVSTSAWGEGFPNVLGEALACAVECVTTDVGDSALVVGNPARVVAIGDSTGLAAAIMTALEESPPCSEGRAGLRERIMAEFSTDRLVDETIRVLT